MPSTSATNGHLNGAASVDPMELLREHKKLVLCFDGTGNSFSGSSADTNVVKILNKLDRHAPRQFHYYQTGIGTYDINETSVNKSLFGELKSQIAMTIDQGIGNTFDAHVMAGYRFLMKFYDTDTKIYMFGFSRGAFTNNNNLACSARFLARMVNTVGLLCKGNEELVPFAYRLYQRYVEGEIEDFTAEQKRHHHHTKAKERASRNGNRSENDEESNPLLADNEHGDHNPRGHNFERAHNEITAFSNTFCRKERVEDEDHDGKEVDRNIKVYFLGLWDCVNSVAPLESHTPVPVPVKGTAQYVRHAVSVDERRVKFKPALLSQDIRAKDAHGEEDLKEVWFPGCHGDVGGGWPAELTVDEHSKPIKKSLWQRIKNIFRTSRPKEASKDVRRDPFQMSDIPLAWMIREVELVGQKDPAAALHFSRNLVGFRRALAKRKQQALTGTIHDSLSIGYGTSFFTVLLWNFMEWLPFITRWELYKNNWVHTRFPLNGGGTRDIPKDAVLHESLIWRLKNDPKYSPKNNHGGWLPPCLKHKGVVAPLKELKDSVQLGVDIAAAPDPDHQTYVFIDQEL
ncbi:hypothetical protein F4861DRAFT_50372 [Xylaria intraflava]|nr:hypothetical protein F4861DRAFT_50372 [Xylaria intraflava]